MPVFFSAMTAHTGEMSVDVPCHCCGYDLRAHPQDGKCPECGASVAEARRVAAIPRRPAWRDSDPRWRRRMLAGAWILVLLPLMDALQRFAWTSSLPACQPFSITEAPSARWATLFSGTCECFSHWFS